jgi:hypothetical protein
MSSLALDLEVWLIGTPAELDQAATTLAHLGRVVYRGPRMALAGADLGRYRAYARIRITTPPPGRARARARTS